MAARGGDVGEAPAPAGQARVAFPPPPPRQATYSLRGSVVLFCEMGVKISTPHGGAARAPRGDEYSRRAVDVGSLGPAGGIIFTSTEACWPRGRFPGPSLSGGGFAASRNSCFSRRPDGCRAPPTQLEPGLPIAGRGPSGLRRQKSQTPSA